MIEPKVKRISPSQLDVWHRCNRRWAFIHRAKRREPFTDAAQAGTETHKVLQDGGPWDKEWTGPQTGKVYPVGQMAALLQAQTPEGVTAREQRWEFELEGLPFVCVTDFLSDAVAGDYKTTSNKRNIKSKKDLLEDPQRLLNAHVVPTATETAWLYGTWNDMNVVPKVIEIDRAEDKKRMHLRVLKPAETMLAMPDDVDPLSVKPNTNDCFKFPPHGCPFKNDCFPPGKLAPVSATTKESSERMATLVEQIRAKAAAARGETPAKEQEAPIMEPAKVAEVTKRLIEAEVTPAQFGVPHLAREETRTAEELMKAGEEVAKRLAAAPAMDPMVIETLYIDCVPLPPLTFETATKYIAQAAEEVQNDLHIPHVMLADFAKGGPALAAQLRANLSGSKIEALYLETRSAEGKAVMNVLMSVSRNVIKGVF